MEKNILGTSEAGKLGGAARAKLLSPEERKAIARAAADARWEKAGKTTLRATHEGVLKIGNEEIPAAVLSDGTRVLSRAQFLRAIGRTGKAKGGRRYDDEFKTPVFLTASNLKRHVPPDLLENSNPVVYRSLNGTDSIGYRAELLPQVCGVFLDADEQGELKQNQKHIATQCRVLIRGLATVGVVALVDEATGFQDDRDRRALAKILEAFIDKELRKWVQTFPVEYYKEMYRLRGLAYPPAKNNRMPQYFGVLTNDIVYKRLAPSVLEELKRKNPANENGRRAAKHHQWLTQDVGHPKLLQHLGAVVATMKMSTNWDDFVKTLDKHYPRQPKLPLFEGTTEPIEQ